MKIIVKLILFVFITINFNAQSISDFNLIVDKVKIDSTFKEYVKISSSGQDSLFSYVEVIDTNYVNLFPNSIIAKLDSSEIEIIKTYSNFKSRKELIIKAQTKSRDSAFLGKYSEELSKISDSKCVKYLLYINNYNDNVIYGIITRYNNNKNKSITEQTYFTTSYEFLIVHDNNKVVLFESIIWE